MYKPNLKDPRVLSRIKTAYGFTKGFVRTEERPIAQSLIIKHFGQDQHPLAKWLRHQLLICTNHHYSMDHGKCKQYKVNESGLLYIRSLIKNPSDIALVKSIVINNHGNELSKKKFIYNDKSFRQWHPLQNLRSEYREVVFSEAGFTFNYDIECAEPTLIMQYAQHNGMDEYPFAIKKYIQNRKFYREYISKLADISEDTAKEIITALFNGAHIGCNNRTSIYKLLQYDEARVLVLKQDPYIIELIQNIKMCWSFIIPTLTRYRSPKTNRLISISPRQKSMVYFQLERQVIDAVMKYLKETNNKCFIEHDGWRCINEIDTISVRLFVKQHTRFDINLSSK